MTDITNSGSRSCNPDIEQWRSMADMLAFTLSDRYGHEHAGCDPTECAVAFVLHRHTGMST